MRITLHDFILWRQKIERENWQKFKAKKHTEKALADEYGAFLERIAVLEAMLRYVHETDLQNWVEI